MNKYESAYEFIELCVRPWEHKSQELDRPVMNTQKQDNMDILKELVEKEKPDKWHEDFEKIMCPICGKYWNIIDNCTETFKYCPNCGKKLD